ncbi:uncharacterized protein DS421_14g454410 [Arachis hypogaea]|nr:uncharacterized protein DS421_14g454410 [Arachis hypogaea]
MRSHSALLIALVERWRPETHTFHLPVGEVTVTLEDVTCILGLPINGAPVTSRLDSSHQFLVENCIACFGRESGPQDHVLGKVNLAWVRRCRDIEPCDTQESFERYVRAHIFCVLGTVVFSDKSTTSLNSKFLPLLQNGTITLTFRIECLRLKLIHSVINSSKYSVAFDCRYHRLHGTKFHSDPKLAIFRCNIASTYDEGTTVRNFGACMTSKSRVHIKDEMPNGCRFTIASTSFCIARLPVKSPSSFSSSTS